MFLSSEPEGIWKNIYKHSWRLDFLRTPRLLFVCFSLLCKIEEGRKTEIRAGEAENLPFPPLWSDFLGTQTRHHQCSCSWDLNLIIAIRGCSKMHPNLTPDSEAEYLSCSWQCDLEWNHWGWKGPVRSLSPSFNAALPSSPLNYFPKVKSNWNKQP